MRPKSIFSVTVDGNVWAENLLEADGWFKFLQRVRGGIGGQIALFRGNRLVAELRMGEAKN